MPSFNIVVPQDFSGSMRLDKYVALTEKEMNRSKLKSGIELILVNGKKSKLSAKVKANDNIVITWEDTIPDDIEPENIPLNIIYEDENVTVVDKKQGMVTHPANGNWNETLVNALLYHWGRKKIAEIENALDSGNLAKLRPGIVHRLDKDTSGIIITAKNRSSEEWLHNQFMNHNLLQKEYIAICEGRPKKLADKIETVITRDTKDRKKYKALPLPQKFQNPSEIKNGKYACSIYQCVGIYERGKEVYSLFKIRIKTGRTHQIRVHLKHIGCPILGDPIYGKAPSGIFKTATLMLHAYSLKIRLLNEEKATEFKSKVPIRFRKVMKTLHKDFRKLIGKS